MKNTYRVEKEDERPHTVFFVKKPSKKELEACEKKEAIYISAPMDSKGTVYKCYPKDEVTKALEPKVETKSTTKPAIPGLEVQASPLSPAPTAAKERRVNVSLTVEHFKDLTKRGAALGLLPGQYARMLIITALNENDLQDRGLT